MEEVFDKIKEHANKAKDSAVQVTKTVIEKTNNIVNQTKLKFSISETKSKIKDIYTEIGKSVYENYKSTGEVIDDMEEKFAKIDAMTEEVADGSSTGESRLKRLLRVDIFVKYLPSGTPCVSVGTFIRLNWLIGMGMVAALHK